MRKSMINIQAVYGKYDELIAEFGEQEIQEQISCLLLQCKEFIRRLHAEDVVVVNTRLLTHAVLDYYSDVSRLKSFHKIQNINDIKDLAYKAHWILKRRPLQISVDSQEDDTLTFINEKFIMSLISSYFLSDDVAAPIVDETLTIYRNFLNSFFYALKFRNLDAQAIELLILGFCAGCHLGKDEERSTR